MHQLQAYNQQILHYCFYVQGYQQPIIIESNNKRTAINLLSIKTKLPIINLKVYRPITGVTKKIINNTPHVWAATLGWITEHEFKTLNIDV